MLGADKDMYATHEGRMQVKEWRGGGNQSIIHPTSPDNFAICQATTLPGKS